MDKKEQLLYLGRAGNIAGFAEKLQETGCFPLTAQGIDIFQVNIGRLCNLSCKHCHVEAGPNRTETMAREVMETCLQVIKNGNFSTIDITGGAPEMNPNLTWFLQELGKLGRRVIVRTNLVILLESPYRQFLDIYRDNKIEIVASLPDYRAGKADRQRGESYFQKFVQVAKELNHRGYGKEGTGLVFNLVHNPVGAYLPASQQALEYEYRTRLRQDQGVEFNHLFCITNMPIGRYLDFLIRTHNFREYMETLANSYNTCAVQNVMCRTTLSVDWRGNLYDCDFNQVLDLPVNHGAPNHIDQFDLALLTHRQIMVANHCYGCTAGMGSSCQGATAE